MLNNEFDKEITEVFRVPTVNGNFKEFHNKDLARDYLKKKKEQEERELAEFKKAEEERRARYEKARAEAKEKEEKKEYIISQIAEHTNEINGLCNEYGKISGGSIYFWSDNGKLMCDTLDEKSNNFINLLNRFF